MSKPRWLELEELDEARRRERRRDQQESAATRRDRIEHFARWMRERGVRWHDHGDDPDARYC